MHKLIKHLIVLSICFVGSFAKLRTFDEIYLLSSTLNNLVNLKNINKQYEERIKEFDQNFYKNLQATIMRSIEKDSPELLDDIGSNAIIEAAKFMMSLAREEYQYVDLASSQMQTKIRYTIEGHEFIALLKTYNKILANYPRFHTLKIASLATGDARKEYLLLRTLVENGYSKIKFYAIDPSTETKDSLRSFKIDSHLKNITFKRFNNADSYIKKIIKKENELPNACIIFGPYGDTGGNIPNLIKTNKNDAMLTVPNNIDELSILSSSNEIIDLLNYKLSTLQDTSRSNIMKIFKERFRAWISYHSIIVDFLEIIRLASSPTQNCIAYLVTGSSIVEYRNIGTKSIAKLYSEYQGAYEAQRIPCPCSAYFYNLIDHQFYYETDYFFSEDYLDRIKHLKLA